MTFTIRSQGRVWCGDIVWHVYPTLPGRRTIRAEGRRIGATMYGRCAVLPNSVGFLTLGDRRARTGEINSLAAGVVRMLGPSAYAEFEFGGDQIWIVATDAQGRLIPGSDRLYAPDDVEAMRETFSGFTFVRSMTVSQEELEAYVARIDPAPLQLAPVRLTALYRRVAVVTGCAAVAWGGLTLYQSHRDAERRRLALLSAAHPVARVEVSPAEWVDACLKASRISPYHRGWMLASWDCSGSAVSMTWARAGGIAADAPSAATIGNDGDSSIQTIAFTPTLGRREQPQEGDPVRQFISMLQRAGIKPAVSTSREYPTSGRQQGVTEVVSIRFSWPLDPTTTIPWDRFARLEVDRISRRVFGPDAGTRDASFDIRVAFKARPPAIAQRGAAR